MLFLTDFFLFFHTETGCDIFWEMNADTQICYQFNLLSVLSWNEACIACQGQGADLLSITDMAEQKYISGPRGRFETMFVSETFHLTLSAARIGELSISHFILLALAPFVQNSLVQFTCNVKP